MKIFKPILVGAAALAAILIIGLIADIALAPIQQDANAKLKQFVMNNYELEQAEFVRAIDGDTIVVNIDGKEATVRLIGIDTPESVHPDASRNTKQGTLASENTKRILENTETLWLQRDVSDTDRYGRLLRYVWVAPDATDPHNMLNAMILADGWAEVATYEPDTYYQTTFEAIADGTYGW